MKTRETNKDYEFTGKAGHVSRKRKRGIYHGKGGDENLVSGLDQEDTSGHIFEELIGEQRDSNINHGSLIEDHVGRNNDHNGALDTEESSSSSMDGNDENQSSLQAEDNDTERTQDAITKFAGLGLNSEPVGDVTDVSSSSSSTDLYTVAYDDIASLVCVVESAHDIFYDEIVDPEVLRNWYNGVRERLRKLSGTSLPPYSAQKPNLSSTSFDSAVTNKDSETDLEINDQSEQGSTKVNFTSPVSSSTPDLDINDQREQGSTKVNFTSPVSSSTPDLDINDQREQGSTKENFTSPVSSSTPDSESNWLPVDFIRNLQNITASEGLISIKMGLTGYLLAYYEPEGKFLENVFDSTTLCPLGRHRLDDFTFPRGPHNVFFVNHDMYIISSLLQLYVWHYKQCGSNREQIIERIIEELETYHRPLLSLSSLSKNSSYGSVEPFGFCAYLAAATSDMLKTETRPDLRTLEVRIFIFEVVCRVILIFSGVKIEKST
jgi:hypothetical protein